MLLRELRRVRLLKVIDRKVERRRVLLAGSRELFYVWLGIRS
jgi:hypothetical protein